MRTVALLLFCSFMLQVIPPRLYITVLVASAANSSTLGNLRETTNLDCCGNCTLSCEFAAARRTCRCDALCEVYGDCCTCGAGCRTAGHTNELAIRTECRSVFLVSEIQQTKPAFWMLSACPESWGHSIEETWVKEKCIVDSSRNLPPVSDVETGRVYKNEYCARCNGQYKECTDMEIQTSLQCKFTANGKPARF